VHLGDFFLLTEPQVEQNQWFSDEIAAGIFVHTYDVDGTRVKTVTTPSGGTVETVEYLVDTSGGLSQVVLEGSSTTAVSAYYVRGDDLISVIRPQAGGPAVVRNYHADGLGSIRALTDEAGLVTDTWQFEAFGSVVSHTGSDPNAYLFAGEMLDPNVGWAYHRARWMDPRVGRFGSMDLAQGAEADPTSLHRYTYTSGDPASWIDPSGLSESLASFTFAAAIAGIVATIVATNILTGLTFSNLPAGAFQSKPSAVVIGFPVDLSAGIAAGRFHPAAGAFLAGLDITTTVEILFTLFPPYQTYLYWVPFGRGLTVDPLQLVSRPSLVDFAIYGGLVWGMSKPSDYLGTFYCASHAMSRPGWPSASLCTSPGPGAYSLGVSKSPGASPWSASWLYYHGGMPIGSIPGDIAQSVRSAALDTEADLRGLLQRVTNPWVQR
jgi:RHS repeat-associated protein